jgi:hypothetical protein
MSPHGNLFSRLEPLLLIPVAPDLSSRGWMEPVLDSVLRKSGSAGNRTRDLFVCSQELLTSIPYRSVAPLLQRKLIANPFCRMLRFRHWNRDILCVFLVIDCPHCVELNQNRRLLWILIVVPRGIFIYCFVLMKRYNMDRVGVDPTLLVIMSRSWKLQAVFRFQRER